jgi:uncharacterized MAPEG superfamily protein
MTGTLSPELYWTVFAAAWTATLWIPYVLQRMVELGIWETFRDPTHHVPTKAAWAQRAMRAHANAIENLVVFGVLATAIQLSGRGTSLTSLAAEVFFLTRIAHYLLYALAVPWLRTVNFLFGFICQITLFVALLK